MAPSGDAPSAPRRNTVDTAAPRRRHLPERLMTTTFADPASPAITRPAAAAPGRDRAGRMDLYASIHKALRALHDRHADAVGRIDVADRADRDEALGQLDELLGLCLAHLRHENEFVHAAIEARQPAGSRRIADEHVEHAESIAALQGEAAALRQASGVDSRAPGAASVPPPRALRRRELPAHAHRGDGPQRPALAALQRRRARRACTAG